MVKLGDVCTIVSGTTPKSTQPEYWDGDLNWVTPAELTEESNVIYESQRKITQQAVIDSSLKSFPAGTVLLSSRAPIGKVAIAGTEMYCNQGFKNLICSEKIYNRYLYHYLKGKAEYLNSLGRGATFKEISKAIVENIEIPLPPLDEQRKIAAVLDKVSDLIAKRRQQLTKLDELVKSRFIELFGDPDTNPYNWGIATLDNFCDLQNGYAFRSNDYVKVSTVLNCRMSNIRPDGRFDGEYNPKYLPNEFWEVYKDYRLIDGDVIIAMTDMASDPKILGVPTIVKTNGKHFLLNQRVGKLIFYGTDCINNVYLMFILSQKHIRRQLIKNAGGSTQINVGKPAILGVQFFVPPIVLQNQFASFVEQTDKSKLAIQKGLEQLEMLKKVLIQDYFG